MSKENPNELKIINKNERLHYRQIINQLKQHLAEKDKEIEELKQWKEWYSMWHNKFKKQIEDLTTELEIYRPTKLHGNGQCKCFNCNAINWTDWCSKYKGHIYCDDCLKEILKEEYVPQIKFVIQELEKVNSILTETIIEVTQDESDLNRLCYLEEISAKFFEKIQQQISELKDFYELIDSGASDLQLRELYPSLFLREFNKLNDLRNLRKFEIFKKQERDVEVIYIYGPSGSGKTTYVRDLIRNKEPFYVDTFDNSAFTGYAGEDILVIDEFRGAGQFNIQFMNRLLDFSPVKLRGLKYLGQACFTKVYIISNFHYKELYKQEQEENISQYNGFVRRLSKVIRINSPTDIFVERETIYEDIPASEQKPYGRKKRIKQVVEYDKYGRVKIVFDRYNKQTEQIELALYSGNNDDLPF